MNLKNPSLLITDDDSDFREILREAFEPRGFCTLTAADGVETLELLRTTTVHILLLDMHMPRLTGLETLRQIRQFDDRLPCILLSAGMDDQLADEAKRAQAFSALAKPIRLAEVRGVVERALAITYAWTPADN